MKTMARGERIVLGCKGSGKYVFDVVACSKLECSTNHRINRSHVVDSKPTSFQPSICLGENESCEDPVLEELEPKWSPPC